LRVAHEILLIAGQDDFYSHRDCIALERAHQNALALSGIGACHDQPCESGDSMPEEAKVAVKILFNEVPPHETPEKHLPIVDPARSVSYAGGSVDHSSGMGLELFESGRAHLSNVPAMVERFQSWGVPLPHLNVYISAYTEMFGGILLMAGPASRLIAIPLFFNFCVAYLTGKPRYRRQFLPSGPVQLHRRFRHFRS